MAYAYDDNGCERFEAHVRDLTTGAELPDVIPGTLSSIVWTSDSKGFVYGLANENWRTDNAHYHKLGDDPAKAKLLYKEAGYRFRRRRRPDGAGGLDRHRDRRQCDREIRLVPANDPTATPIMVSPRQVGTAIFGRCARRHTLHLDQ